MFFFLSKAIDFLVMPSSVILILLSIGYFSKSRKRAKVIFALVFGVIFLMSNNYFVKKVFNGWEPKVRNINTLPNYDVGILLSGGLTSGIKPSSDHYALGDHADRVLQTFLLYKAGKIKKILITGTSQRYLMAIRRGETREAADMLVSWGVKPEDIVFEENARNTRENALFSAKILKSKFPDQKYVLITSAFHMRRSAGCFEKAGIKTEIFPADFYGGYNKLQIPATLIPDADAFAGFSVLWHELVGYVVYKLVGYA